MNTLLLKMGLLTTTVLLSAPAAAQVTYAPAPDVTFLMGADIFSGGQSNNLGPALSQVLDNHWTSGTVCAASNNYADCDAIRFGMTVYPPGSCADTINVQVAAQEDGGGAVEARAQSIHNEGGTTWCNNADFRPHDTGLNDHHTFTFPNGSTASDVELDQYWERPRLSMMFIGTMPQSSNSTPDPNERTIESLRTACRNYAGAGGILPSMPTWTFVTRKFDTEAVPYAGLVAAAGGTASCCYGTPCDPLTDAIDVCAHIEDGRDDTDIRTDILAGEYECGSNGTTYGVGALDFGSKNKGTLPEIRCLLVGTDNNDNCSSNNRKPTDILGVFACVRQLPRGVTAADANFLYCPTTDPADCQPIGDVGGSIEWIDENQTLYLVEGVACDAIAVTTCEENIPCVVENEVGRCKIGKTDCSTGTEVCVSALPPMPEICNGLDDDCDGSVDNMRDSWKDSQFANLSLPDDHPGLHCNLRDVCTCPNGVTDFHAGPTFSEYLDEWDPVCACGEGLEPAEPNFGSEFSEGAPDAACSATGSRDAAPVLWGLIGFGLLVWSRKPQRRRA